MVKFGIEFVPSEPYWKTTFYAIQAEKRGFDYLWITDHFNNRNVYVTLTAAALHTERIKLGPGVTNPYLINPVITAQAIASLDELAPSRVILGIGAGDKTTLKSTGMEMHRPLTAVKECVEIVRRMISEKSVTFEGNVFKTSDAKFFFKPRTEIPVYVGAQGPKMLELAGRIGDGVLINAGQPKDEDYAVERARKGIEQAGKRLTDVDIAAYTSFSVHEDLKKAAQAAVRPAARTPRPPAALPIGQGSAGEPLAPADDADPYPSPCSARRGENQAFRVGQGVYALQFHIEVTAEMIEAWLDEQIKEKKVEPNSSLGEAIDFMQRHWEKLTRFLHVPDDKVSSEYPWVS